MGTVLCKDCRAEDEKIYRPPFGLKRVSEITAPALFNILLSIQDKGYLELSRRLKQIVSMIFRYEVAKRIVSFDPAASLGRDCLLFQNQNTIPQP